jgi:hypothetical protein
VPPVPSCVAFARSPTWTGARAPCMSRHTELLLLAQSVCSAHRSVLAADLNATYLSVGFPAWTHRQSLTPRRPTAYSCLDSARERSVQLHGLPSRVDDLASTSLKTRASIPCRPHVDVSTHHCSLLSRGGFRPAAIRTWLLASGRTDSGNANRLIQGGRMKLTKHMECAPS